MYYVYYDFDSKLKLSFDITTIQYGRHMWSGAIFETEKKRILGCHSDIPTCMPYIFFYFVSSRYSKILKELRLFNPHTVLWCLWGPVQWLIEYILYINNLSVPKFRVILPDTLKFILRWFHTENVKNVEEIYDLLKKNVECVIGPPRLAAWFWSLNSHICHPKSSILVETY